MRGLAPDQVLDRRTKEEFSAEVYAGLQRNRASLAALFADSELARRGLLDPVEVRSAIVDSARRDHETTALEQTLGTEVWARAAARRWAVPSGVPVSSRSPEGGGLR